MEEDCVVVCQPLYPSIGEAERTDMHERRQRRVQENRCLKAGQEWLVLVRWRGEREMQPFFSAKKYLEAALNKVGTLVVRLGLQSGM